MKDTATLKTSKQIEGKDGKLKTIKRPPTIKQINQRLAIFRAKFNKPDILDIFEKSELNKILMELNEK